MKWTIILLASFVLLCSTLDNGLGRTPQMGWNSWNHYGCNVNEGVVRKTADAFVSSGLKDAGYNYVNVDDCWAWSRNATGYIQADPQTFPSGMKALADYVHSKGLKFGLYSDAGYKTCAGRPGSLGFESKDAESYASWGVDYLKYDNCNTDGTSPEVRYPVMRDALKKTGRPIFYSMCEWGVDNPATWAAPVGNSWRTTGDISDNWASMTSRIDQNNAWASYAAPGGWNDPDMLEVGNGGMTTAEYRSHFSLWCLAKAPLLVGCDATSMNDITKMLLTPVEVIAINQDKLGVQGKKLVANNGLEVWGGPLSSGASAVILFNRNMAAAPIQAMWTSIGLKADQKALVRNLWTRTDAGVYTGSFSAVVPPHDVVFVTVTPQ